MKGEWKHSSLGAIAPFSGDRVSLMELSVENYVSTDTLLPNRAGRELANGLPPFQGNIPAYKCGDILISNIRPYLKKIWIADSYGGCSADVLIFRAEKDIDSKFLFYILSQDHFFEYMMGSSKGSKMPRGDKSVIEKYPVCIPAAFTDQQHIADILTSCDEVIEQTEKAIAKYRDIKAGMLQDLFTRGVDANGKLRPKPEDAPQLYKDSPLGKIPKEWETDELQTVFSVSSGDNLPAKKIKPGSFPVFGGNGISGYHHTYNVNEIKLIIGRVGEYCGNTFISPKYAWITDNALIVTFKSEQNISFWRIYLDFINLNRFAFAAAQPVITGKLLSKINVALIKPEEQNCIVDKIEGISTLIEKEEQTLAKYRSIKLGLMKKLLTPPEGALEA